MRLVDWATKNGHTQASFHEWLNRLPGRRWSRQVVTKAFNGGHVRPALMVDIYIVTRREVAPQDFFQLPSADVVDNMMDEIAAAGTRAAA